MGKSLHKYLGWIVGGPPVFAHPDAVLAFAVVVTADADGEIALLFVEAARGRIFFLNHEQHVAIGQRCFQRLQQAFANAKPPGIGIDADIDDAGKPAV